MPMPCEPLLRHVLRDEALTRGRQLERYGLYWYEEPTIPEDVPGHARHEIVYDLAHALGAAEALVQRPAPRDGAGPGVVLRLGGPLGGIARGDVA